MAVLLLALVVLMVSRQINKVVQQQDLPAPRWTACRATGFPPALSRSGAAHGGMEPPIPPVPMAGLFGALPILLWLVATQCGGNAVGKNRRSHGAPSGLGAAHDGGAAQKAGGWVS